MAMATSDWACALLVLLPAVVVLLHGEAARSSASFPLGGEATVRLPPAPHQPRFAARAVVLDDARGERQPGFVAAVSAEAARAGAGTCSLVLFLGGVKVWASDHLEEFVARALCRLELTEDGQLRLTDGGGKVGWLSGTAGLGVKVMTHRLLFSIVCLMLRSCMISPWFCVLRRGMIRIFFVDLDRGRQWISARIIGGSLGLGVFTSTVFFLRLAVQAAVLLNHRSLAICKNTQRA